jgi:hypothetical protein
LRADDGKYVRLQKQPLRMTTFVGLLFQHDSVIKSASGALSPSRAEIRASERRSTLEHARDQSRT